ncbi:MAG: hypothetical protein WCP32_18000 [Bacteroidota bacterium]
MKIHFAEKKVSSVILFVGLIFLTQEMSFCQNKPNPAQQPQEKSQTLTPAQTATIKTILSKYNASKLTEADAKAIHEKLRDAGIHAGPETGDAIIAAGFDPEKLRTLDPPKNPDNKGKSIPISTEERLKTLQEKVIKPLALTSTQNETVVKAYKEFFASMESLKKAQANSQPPLDKSKVEPIEKARDEKIRQVLSKEQFVKYQELEKASRPAKPTKS